MIYRTSFFFSSRRRHTRSTRDWSSDVCSSDLGGGTVAFALVLNESALEAFYRATVTISLTGIDTKPPGPGGEVTTIVLILAGMAIYGYLASSLVELIAHGVLTGAMAERRRRRVIERMSDHFIICGYGRVGRQVVEEFQ